VNALCIASSRAALETWRSRSKRACIQPGTHAFSARAHLSDKILKGWQGDGGGRDRDGPLGHALSDKILNR
jgi:hypothetical protein